MGGSGEIFDGIPDVVTTRDGVALHQTLNDIDCLDRASFVVGRLVDEICHTDFFRELKGVFLAAI